MVDNDRECIDQMWFMKVKANSFSSTTKNFILDFDLFKTSNGL